ncbi:MAG: hypothetical protein KFB93_06050 [Simkaniaceae bacterium]|nr:MAG: hypothetical protein KFB93_06050 [Simkaniaceae bacterium]
MGISVSNVLENQAYESQLENFSQNSNDQQDMQIKSMTYNLRIQEADQKDKNSPYYWENRKQAILDMVSGKVSNNGQNLDFVALQECGTTYSYHTWETTINEAMKPGGELQGYGAVEIGDGDNIILYKKDKWQLGKNQTFTVGSNQVVAAQFTRIGHPGDKPVNVFGGHLPHGGAAPKDLQGVANDIRDFEGASGTEENWADNYQTIFMMDSNDKEKIDGDPSYDHDAAFNWAGFHDIAYGDKGDFTNHAWDFEGSPDLREDLQFLSGYDKDADNTSEVVHYKYNYNGQIVNPSDHLAVLNTTYFKESGPTPPQFPHTPSSTQDLENELTEFVTSTDPFVKALGAAVQSQVQDLAGKELSLTSIESWAYAAIVGKFTANPEYSIGFQNISPSEQATFKTITGIDAFQEKLSSHSFSLADVTGIAKSFADGTISLQNPNDVKFMQSFYSNLQSGQDPAAAAENAYSVVPFSSLSQGMQVFVTDLTNTVSGTGSINGLSHSEKVQQELNTGLFSSTEENPFGRSGSSFEGELF